MFHHIITKKIQTNITVMLILYVALSKRCNRIRVFFNSLEGANRFSFRNIFPYVRFDVPMEVTVKNGVF
jgi:nucleoside permease NupC